MRNDGIKKALGIIVCVVVGVGALFLSEYDGSDTSTGTGASSVSTFGVDPPVFTETDSRQLAKRLDEAYKHQGVCYGWRVNNNEIGSNLGVGRSAKDDPACQKFAELVVDYTYNSTDEEFTDVTYSIDTSAGISVRPSDLTAIGIGRDELLDEPVVGVTDAIGALPMLVAEKGEAPAVPAPQEQNTSRNDTLERTIEWRWVWIVLAIGLLGGGLVWLIVGAVRAARKPETQEPTNQGMGSQ
jgi:hypothetical protein